jgi:hypothetical protein
VGLFDGSVAFAREWRERRERRRMRSDARVKARNEAKAKLSTALAPLYRGDVDAEVVIRDADRQDGYPRIDDKFRVWRLSPWFKVELHKPWGEGISVWLEIRLAVVGDGVVRVVEHAEHGELVHIVGRIPYEVIAGVDSEGDVDYPMPQIFCHFDFNRGREPYRETVAYRDHGDGHWFPMEGLPIVGRKRSSLWSRWRHHREAERLHREFQEQHPSVPPTPPLADGEHPDQERA